MLTNEEPIAVVEIDALQFAAGERARLAVEGEILQADADQIPSAAANFVEDQTRHLIEGAGRFQRGKKIMGDADVHGVDLGDIFAVDAIVERVGFEPTAVTLGAKQIGAVARQQDAHMHAVAAPLEAAKPAADAFVFAVAVDDQLALRVAQLAPGRFHRDFLAVTKVEQPLGSALAVDPGFDGAVG